MLLLFAESQEYIKLSAQEKSEYLTEYKKNTELYFKEKSNFEENIIINKSPFFQSFISSNSIQNFLDIFTQQIENKVNDQILAEDNEIKLLRSGLGKYRDRFEYVYINTKSNFNGIERFFIETIRVNERYDYFGLNWSQAQFISIGLILLGTGGALYLLKYGKRHSEMQVK